MPTINEQKAIKLIYLDPDISLREISQKLGLAGASSALHIINSLEKKEYLKKIGLATSKQYQLTEKALALYNIISMEVKFSAENQASVTNTTSPISGQSTGFDSAEKFPQFLPGNFNNGSTDIDYKGTLGAFLSASFMNTISSPVGWQRYGDVVVLVVILTIIVLPACHMVLGDQWFVGFLLIAFISLITLINKK